MPAFRCVAAATLLVSIVEAGDQVREPAPPPADVVAPLKTNPLRNSGAVHVLIHLNDPPVAQVYATTLAASALPKDRAEADATSAAQAHLTRIKEAQENLAAILAQPRFGAREIYRVQRALNAIAVTIDAERLEQLRQLPGVKQVRPLVPESPTSVPQPPDAHD